AVLVSFSTPARSVVFYLLLSRPAMSALFPYTTLFRSGPRRRAPRPARRRAGLRPRRPGLRGGAAQPAARARADRLGRGRARALRSEEHTSELQSRVDLVCRLLLEKKNKDNQVDYLCSH